MSRRIKDYIEIKDHATLDDLIERLIDLRNALPDDAQAELRLRGDDIFGRKLSISYLRELTQEEVDCELRYADAGACAFPRGANGGDKDWRDVA